MYTPKGTKEEAEMKNLNEKMKTYHLPTTSTYEKIECDWSTVVRFGNKILVAGYYYSGSKANNYFGATYEFTTADKTCEGKIRLIAISDEHFEDAGHALQWGMTC